jgi:hypothetical protein
MTKSGPIPTFIDNPAISSRPASYTTVTVALAPVLASWRESLFAHEWLRPDGSVKPSSEQASPLQEKRAAIEARIKDGAPLERPVLGIGILDTVEIGSGRDTLLTLAAAGISQASVHIPKSHLDEFRLFIKP